MKGLVLEAARRSFEEGLFAGTSGNLSLRDRESGLVAITPGSVAYPSMTEEDIVLLTPEGDKLEGRREPSSEWRMHTRLYKLRRDIGAVVHTHSPHATAFAAVNRPIPVALIEMVFFLYGEVPVARYCPPGSAELADRARDVLERRTACLMANHGVLAVGSTLEEAHIRAVYVEDAAKICSIAASLGELVTIPRAEQNVIRRKLGIPEE